MNPTQRETLFHSKEEKRAAIEDYQREAIKLNRIIDTMERQLANLKQQHEMVSRRIQGLQNLDIFDDGGEVC